MMMRDKEQEFKIVMETEAIWYLVRELQGETLIMNHRQDRLVRHIPLGVTEVDFRPSKDKVPDSDESIIFTFND